MPPLDRLCVTGLKKRRLEWAGGISGLEAEAFAEVLGLAAGEFYFGAALDFDEETATEPGLDLVDPLEVDHLAAVGAEEGLGVEARFHRVEGTEELGLGVVEVKAGVVALAFEEADGADFDKPAAVALADEDLVEGREARGSGEAAPAPGLARSRSLSRVRARRAGSTGLGR